MSTASVAQPERWVPSDAPDPRAPFAWRVVAPPAVLLVVLVVATSGGYGYERDELYFRMLPLAWGYEDQPPFVPWLAHAMSSFSDSLVVLRLPSAVFAAATVLVCTLIARELGGDPRAQGIAAWSTGFCGAALTFAHILLTAGPDLLLWTATLLFAARALLRDPRWWLAAGAVAGLATYVKYLIVLLVLSVLISLLVVGPRRALTSRWLLGGVGVALVLAAPNLGWQAAHGWPQLTMTGAIAQDKGSTDRATLLPFQFLITGPPLVPIWIAGLVALVRRPQWRPLRALAVAYPVLLLVVLLTGGQVYYPLGLLLFLLAAGAVPVADWTRRTTSRVRMGWVVAAVASTVVVSSLIALPIVPVSAVGSTPIPAINQVVRDQVGWPTYVAQIRAAYRAVPAARRATTIVLTSNYGEAGAVHQYGRDLPPVYSGQNALYFLGPPPASTTTVVTVGFHRPYLAARFTTCRRAATLDNGVGVDNEEQGDPVEVCSGARQAWPTLWPAFRHND